MHVLNHHEMHSYRRNIIRLAYNAVGGGMMNLQVLHSSLMAIHALTLCLEREREMIQSDSLCLQGMHVCVMSMCSSAYLSVAVPITNVPQTALTTS